MYEAELNDLTEPLETIPPDIRMHFSEYRDRIEARTLIPWGEHCTECVWPSCYKTCQLYQRRNDGACRQFVDGVVRISHSDGVNPYIQKITFSRWGKFWAAGKAVCYPLRRADLIERVNLLLGYAARNLPLPGKVKQRVLRKMAYIRRRMLAEGAIPSKFEADYLVIEIYNPCTRQTSLSLSLKPRGNNEGRAYNRLVLVAPGFNREKVPIQEISGKIDLRLPFEIELVPNASDNVTLYFGLTDFVREKEDTKSEIPAKTELSKCKCVVWDLDNTLWDGILVEDGPENLRLKEEVRYVIQELDRRGILNSVASKNNYNDAMSVLRRFDIADYFLYPQIDWQPKSSSVAAIAKSLNIGLDTLIFVDDQEFERSEVKSALPQVTVLDAAEAKPLLQREECQVPVTDESKNRRIMYRQEEQRTSLLKTYRGDYITFLRDCQIRLVLTYLKEENLERVYEMAQRTNQMNFSGKRYTLDELRDIMFAPHLKTYVMRCSDRFGSYGIIGFGIVDGEEPRLLDLMFSCRIQGKRVDYAFLSYILKEHLSGQKTHFFANLRKTEKNAPSSAVFGEIGFEEVETQEGITSLVYKKNQGIPDERIIDIVWEE